MRNTVSDALSKYWEVRSLPKFQPERIVAYALASKRFKSSTRANEALLGLLQVLSCLSERDRSEVPLILAQGDVFEMYNTLSEMSWGENKSFDHFCSAHFQAHHHIHCLDKGGLTTYEVVEAGGVVYTLGQLEGLFDIDLANALNEWTVGYQRNQLVPAAILWTKKWQGDMLPAQRSALLKIINRWNQCVN